MILPCHRRLLARFAAVLAVMALVSSVTRRVSAEARGAVLLLVHGDDLPKERLRDLVAKELDRPVALNAADSDGGGSMGVVTVTYRKVAKELAVTWDGPRRGTVSRVVTAPPKMDDVVRDAAMLAGNLARDEAAELMPREPDPPLPAPSTPTPPPAESPPPDPAPAAAKPDEPRAQTIEPFTVGFFYPLATNMDRPWARTRFAFNVMFGRIGQLEGFQLGGVNGVDRIEGKSSGDTSGLQIASVGNVVGGDVGGVQIAVGFNVGKRLDGWQSAMLVNHVEDDATGLQTASLVNHVGGTLAGAQVGLVNVGGDVRGAQVGLVNVGGNVRGAQVGLVNVADHVDGVPIGLASVTKDGGVHPTAWSSIGTLANLGIKLATKHVYTMPSAHFHRAYDRDYWGLGFTIGARIPLGDKLGPYVDVDAGAAWLVAPEPRSWMSGFGVREFHEHVAQPRVRGVFGYRFAEHFGLFAGTGVLGQFRLLRGGDGVAVRVGPEFVGGVEL